MNQSCLIDTEISSGNASARTKFATSGKLQGVGNLVASAIYFLLSLNRIAINHTIAFVTGYSPFGGHAERLGIPSYYYYCRNYESEEEE